LRGLPLVCHGGGAIIKKRVWKKTPKAKKRPFGQNKGQNGGGNMNFL
jgi:hypothetical protein